MRARQTDIGPAGITRRDFLNGVAVGIGGSLLGAPELLAQAAGLAYPPALTGLRGSHVGSFEVAHALALEGPQWPRPGTANETYDLVVVGGGLSGLTAAWFYRDQAGGRSRILILDNHADFGGHANR